MVTAGLGTAVFLATERKVLSKQTRLEKHDSLLLKTFPLILDLVGRMRIGQKSGQKHKAGVRTVTL